jgi:hypothetical protein
LFTYFHSSKLSSFIKNEKFVVKSLIIRKQEIKREKQLKLFLIKKICQFLRFLMVVIIAYTHFVGSLIRTFMLEISKLMMSFFY